MTTKRKYLLLATIVFIGLIAGVVIIVLIQRTNNQTTNNIVSNPISTSALEPVSPSVNNYIKGDALVENVNFGYKFNYSSTLIHNSVQPIDEFSILGGDTVQVDPKNTKSYQGIEVIVQVYNRNIMNNLSLEDWIRSVSTEKSEELDNKNKKYLSSSFISIEEGKIAFLINNEPFLNGSNPVLLFDNGLYLYEYTKAYIDNETYFNIASSFQIKFDNEYNSLTSEELTSIKKYLNKP